MRYFFIILLTFSTNLMAGTILPEAATPEPGQVLVSGTVPDEASKAGVLVRLRELYGAEKVVDQIIIGPVVLPANWNSSVQKLLNKNLKLISHGQLKVDGNIVSIRGEVSNELQRQQVASDIATNLNSTYTVNNGLHISSTDQSRLDSVLANRIVEFRSGDAILTQKGQAILDELSLPLLQMKNEKLAVIGHTDNSGLRASNISLSKARAEAVKSYLSSKGIEADAISATGVGFDNPVASNETVEGRARNRRIEFRIVK